MPLEELLELEELALPDQLFELELLELYELEEERLLR